MSSRIKLEGDIVGLDIGGARTGVARMSTFTKIAEALPPASSDQDELLEILEKRILLLRPCAVVVGLPRGLDGQETDQTRSVMKIATTLEARLAQKAPVYLVDEAGTTKEAELRARKGLSVDSVAACIILETFMSELEKGKIDNAFI